MAFEPKSFSQLFTEMRDRTPASISDFETGSVARTLYETFAYEMALLYEQMHRVYLSGFVETATGIHLERVVAVLGIQRGEPDFATGLVTFERDLGIDETLEIPLGFVVTTSEDADTVKKSYQTVETKQLGPTDNQVQVRVQAIAPSDSEATAANTIEVMPQPLTGIKAVTNEQPIRFTGKHRETDDELRVRAKTALLATSGANTTTIENAVFNLPGVKEVQVRENFHFARGQVTLTPDLETTTETTTEITIPRGTELVLDPGGNQFKTSTVVRLNPNLDLESPQKVDVEAVVRGEAGQVDAAATWQPLELDGGVVVTIHNNNAIVLKDFGLIEVFVDGVDFTNPTQVQALETAIDRSRAAGIYVLPKPAQAIQLDGVFLVELTPGRRWSTEERQTLEQQLQVDLTEHLQQQSMGQPLLMSQLTQTLLSPAAVNDLVDFTLTTALAAAPAQTHDAATKRLDADIHEKFEPRHLRVATEIKPLVVQVYIQATGLSDELHRSIEDVLQTFFNRLRPAQSIQRQRLIQQLEAVAPDQNFGATVELVPQFWSATAMADNNTSNDIPVSLVEQAELGHAFIYEHDLDISGALKLTVAPKATVTDKRTIQAEVEQQLSAYLAGLQPEQNVDMGQLANLASEVKGVLGVNWRQDDVQVWRSTGETRTLQADRLDGNEIRVDRFERPRLAPEFAIATDIQTIPISITNLTLHFNITGTPFDNQSALETAIQQTLKAHLPDFVPQLTKFEPAQSLAYDSFKTDIFNAIGTHINSLDRADIQTAPDAPDAAEVAEQTKALLQGSNYTLATLNLFPPGGDILIRLTERAVLQPLTAEAITITLDWPLFNP
ncbi:putative phage Mu protein gp47-like protein [Leptolyngbya sp. PCC 7375]|nr:putative phage Mu protein gp47-like protein [Leptolyngbya sp. PCC 7375]